MYLSHSASHYIIKMLITCHEPGTADRFRRKKKSDPQVAALFLNPSFFVYFHASSALPHITSIPGNTSQEVIILPPGRGVCYCMYAPNVLVLTILIIYPSLNCGALSAATRTHIYKNSPRGRLQGQGIHYYSTATEATTGIAITMSDGQASQQQESVSMSPGADAGEKTEQQQQLPKLTASEFRQYNRLAEHMDQFVNLPHSLFIF